MQELLHHVPQIGRLEWIGLSSARRAAIQAVAEVELRPGTGLVGDHHAQSGRGMRQVTLIQHEHLPVIAVLSGVEEVRPEQTRRNLVVSGINLLSLKGLEFRVGQAVLLGAGECAPCSRMDETLGEGGFQAMRGHGGIVATVLHGGTVRCGDEVRSLGADDSTQ